MPKYPENHLQITRLWLRSCVFSLLFTWEHRNVSRRWVIACAYMFVLFRRWRYKHAIIISDCHGDPPIPTNPQRYSCYQGHLRPLSHLQLHHNGLLMEIIICHWRICLFSWDNSCLSHFNMSTLHQEFWFVAFFKEKYFVIVLWVEIQGAFTLVVPFQASLYIYSRTSQRQMFLLLRCICLRALVTFQITIWKPNVS